MAFTKVVGPGIHTLAQLRTHNIHSAGIITATKFVGEMESGGGESTFQNVTVQGNLTVQGDQTTLNTTLRNVELLRVAADSDTTYAGIITQTGTGNILGLFDGSTRVFNVADGGAISTKSLTVTGDIEVVDTSPRIKITDSDASNAYAFIDGQAGKLKLFADLGGNVSNSEIVFGVDSSTPKMVIKDTGHVGIGTDNAGRILTIRSSEPRIRLMDDDTGGHAEIYTDNNHNLQFSADSSSSSGSSQFFFRVNGTEKVRIQEDGDIIYGSGDHIIGGDPALINGLGSHHNNNMSTITYGINDGGNTCGMRVENFDDGTYNAQRVKFLTAKGGFSMATVRMTIDEDGRVGIGSTLPLSSVKLDVVGKSRYSDDLIILSGKILTLLNPANTANVKVACDGGARLNVKSYDQSVIQAQENWGVRFFQGNETERLAIEPTGGIVVGTGGTIYMPEYIKHRGDTDTYFGFSGDNTFKIYTNDAQRLQINNTGVFQFNHSSVGGYYNFQGPTSDNNWGGYLKLNSYNNSTVKAEIRASTNGLWFQYGDSVRLDIDNDGAINIGHNPAQATGTNTQNAILTIKGYPGGNETSAAILALVRGNNTTSTAAGHTLGRIVFSDKQAGEYAMIEGEAEHTGAVGDTPGRLIFATASDGATTATEKMRLDMGGNLIVGDTAVGNAGSFGVQSTGAFRSILAAGNASDTLLGAISGVSNGFQVNVAADNGQTYTFHNGSTVSFRIDTSGRVRTDNGTQVSDFDITRSNSTITDVMLVKGNTGNGFIRFQDNDASCNFTLGADDGAGVGANSFILYDRVNSAYRLSIDNNGTMRAWNQLQVGNFTIVDTRNDGGIHIQPNKGISFKAYSSASASRNWRIRNDDAAWGNLDFSVGDNNSTDIGSGAADAVLSLSANHRVGINSITPQHPLDVAGNIRSYGQTPSLYLQTTANTAESAVIRFGDTGSFQRGAIQYDFGGISHLRFKMGGYGNAVERMTLTGAGCLNIGGDYSQQLDRVSIIAGHGYEAMGIGGTTKGIRFGWDGDRTAYDDLRIYRVDYSNSGTFGIGGNNPTFVITPTTSPGSGFGQETVWLKSTGRGSGNNEMNLCVDGDVVIGGDGQLGGASVSGYPGSLAHGLGKSKLTIQPDHRTTAFAADDGDTWHDVVLIQGGGATRNAVGIAFEIEDGGSYHKNAGTGIAAVKNGTNSDYGADLRFINRPQSATAKESVRITSNGQFLRRQEPYSESYQDANFGNADVIKSGWMRFNSSFSNPTKDLVILADGGNANNNLFIKVTVVQLDYPGTDQGLGSIHTGYASAKRTATGGQWHVEKSNMALESGSNFHGNYSNVGTLSWENSNTSDTNTLRYTSNRYANYDLYNVQVEVWQRGNCLYYLHSDFVT